MKNYLLSILIICLCGLSFGQGIKVEAIAGFNASQIDGDQMAGFNKLGILVGGAAGVELRDNFNVQFRLLYSQKGSRNSENDPIFQVNRINYLDFPLVFIFEPKEHIFLEAGLQVSYLTSAKIDDGFGFGQFRDQFEQTPYGFILGAAYEFERIKLRLNFQRSLSNLTKIPGYLDRTLSFSLVYALN